LIWFIWFIWSIWFNQTNETDQINKRDLPVLALYAPQSMGPANFAGILISGTEEDV